MRLRFADCLFDAECHLLARAGRPVRLTPKAFELLALLLECRPRVVSRAQLHDRLWPASFVGRTSLPRLVSEVRRAIGDSAAEGKLVRTVCSVGYAFAGAAWPADEVAPSGGRSAATAAPPLGTERAEPESQRRLQIVIASGSPVPAGLRSRLTGAWIAARVLLADGEEIEIGPSPLRLDPWAGAGG